MAINNVSGNTLLQSGFFPPVRVASTGSPLTPMTGGLLTVDGVTLIAGDRVLCKDEISAVNNGIYAANTGPWVRTSDASTNQQFFSGMAIICAQGAANSKTIFICTCTDNPVVVGTSLITFAAQLPVGAGNVIGPGSSTTGDVATFSGVTGQLLQDTSTSGTGPVVKANSPTLVSPTLGSASATAVNNVVLTQPASTATLTLASSTVFTVNNTLTLSATSGKTVTFNASTTFSGVDAKTLTIENTLDFAGTDSTRFIFPSVNDTVVGITAVQNIYNKTLTGAAITSGTATNVTFVGGTINSAVIGGVTAAAGTFTSVTAPTIAGGGTASSSLTLESTSGSGTSDYISFQTGSQTERLRITSDGHLLIGLATSLTSLGLNTQFLTVENAGRSGEPGGNHGLFQFSNDASSAYLSFFKTRATSKGSSVTAVQNADGLGEINYNGADGTGYVPQCVYVDALVEGSVSTGVVPTAYVVGTMNASGVVFERFRITHEGNLNINGSLSTTVPQFITAASYTTNTTDSSIVFNASGTVTITLTSPSAPVFTPGRWLVVKTITNNAVVSASSNVAPLAGGSPGTAILAATAGKWAALQWDGANWDIMMAN